MTRYLEQTQSTAIALPNCFREWGFPVRPGCGFFIFAMPESNFVTSIAVKINH
jgi:hypothetical protein